MHSAPQRILLRPDEILRIHRIPLDQIENRKIDQEPEELLEVIGQAVFPRSHLV